MWVAKFTPMHTPIESAAKTYTRKEAKLVLLLNKKERQIQYGLIKHNTKS